MLLVPRRRPLLSLLALGCAFAAMATLPPATASGRSSPCLQGVNLSGAEYGEGIGVYGKDYIYPSEKTVGYFAAKGMNAVRLPFKWERLQPVLGARLSGEELQRLKQAVASIRGHGMAVILDPHNYARYNGRQIGSRDVPNFAFADFWARLSVEFADQEGVIFGLMNEPYDIQSPDWLAAANEAIRSIRSVGAGNLVLVPGTIWTGAHSWQNDIPGGSNASVMLGVEDSAGNYAYDLHQYLDSDFSGTQEACLNAGRATQALSDVTAWLRQNGKRGFLGEFGAAANAQCLAGLSDMLDVLATDRDVWLGWTYWAGGDWWPDTEAMNVQPTAAGDRKQLAPLVRAIAAAGSAVGGCGGDAPG